MHGARMSGFWVHKNRGKMYSDAVGTAQYNEHNLSPLLMTWKPRVTPTDHSPTVAYSERLLQRKAKGVTV